MIYGVLVKNVVTVLVATTSTVALSSVIQINAVIGRETPPQPVRSPHLSSSDVRRLEQLPCVAMVGAFTRQRMVLLDSEGIPRTFTVLNADSAAISVLGYVLSAASSAQKDGLWLNDDAIADLRLTNYPWTSPATVTRRTALVGVSPSGTAYVDEAVPLNGRIVDSPSSGRALRSPLILRIDSVVSPAGTILTGRERIVAAVPPTLVVRTQGEAKKCISSIEPLLESWRDRTGVKFEAGVFP